MGGRKGYSFTGFVGKSKPVKEKAEDLKAALSEGAADVAVDTALDMATVAAPGLNSIILGIKLAKWGYSVYKEAGSTYEATNDKREVAKTVARECLQKSVALPLDKALTAAVSNEVDIVKKAYNIRSSEVVDQLIAHTTSNTIMELVTG